MADVMVDKISWVIPAHESESGSSFEAFVTAEQAALQNFAFLITGNREDARDAVQDAFIGALRHWGRAQANPGAYLRRSIVNAHVSRWRKRRWETPTDEVSGVAVEPPGPDTLWVQAMCRALPRKQRAAVVLRFFEDKSFAQIGEIIGCSEATARSLLSRAIATLRCNNSEG